MAADQVTVTKESLHEGFRRSTNQIGFVLVASWLWAIFSFFTSTSAGTWFARSGSVMCLIGAVAAFKVINDYNRALGTAVEHGITQSRRVELVLDPPKHFLSIQYFAYLTGVVGTLIWGYGDLLVHLFS